MICIFVLGPRVPISPYRCPCVFHHATLLLCLLCQSDPYLMPAKPEEGQTLSGNARYQGFCADLAELLANQLQIRYMLRPVVDGKYGARTSNGTWNGMVGELIRKVRRWFKHFVSQYSHHYRSFP